MGIDFSKFDTVFPAHVMKPEDNPVIERAKQAVVKAKQQSETRWYGDPDKIKFKTYDDYVGEFDDVLKSGLLYSVMIWWKTTEKLMWETYEKIARSTKRDVDPIQYAIMCGAVKEYVADAVERNFEWEDILDWDKLGVHEHDRYFDTNTQLERINEHLNDIEERM